MKITRESLYLYGGNLFFRGSTIGARFLFTFFLSKEFSLEVLGQYSLFTASIIVFYFLLSFSFDSYSLREMVQVSKDQQRKYLVSHFTFYLASFLFFVPIVAIFFVLDFLPLHLLPYFLFILALETLCQTFFALFTMLQKSVVANVILFLNQGLWIIAAFMMFFLNANLLSIEVFLVLWIGGGLIASIYGFSILRSNYAKFYFGSVDWEWIRRGVYVSAMFFCSTLSYKAIEFADRYFIEHYLGVSQVGIYGLFYQVANLISAAINVTVILILYPRLLTSFLDMDLDNFLAIRRKMYGRIVVLGVSLAVIEALFITNLLDWIGKTVFEDELGTFFVLLGSNIIMNLSFVPHYCLYALKKDGILLLTTLLGAFVNLTLNYFLIPRLGISGAAWSALIGFLVVWLAKMWYLKSALVQLRYSQLKD